MGFGTSLMKLLMFIFNGIVWILGIVLLVIGILVLVEGNNWNDIIDGKTVPISIMLIIVGLAISIVGFLGCCGAMKQNGKMLIAYTIILAVIIMLQLVAGILAFIFSDQAIKAGHSGFVTAMANYDPSEKSTTNGINWLQKHLDCCGIQNASDWRVEANKAKIWIISHINDVPDTCCIRLKNQWSPTPGCGEGQAMGNSVIIHNGGCYKKMVSWLQTYMPLMGVLALIFVVFEACVIVISCMLRVDSELTTPLSRIN